MPKYGLNFLGDGAYWNNLSPLINGIIGNIGTLIFGGEEDCLYLDVYVPGSSIKIRSSKKVPVVNWITGGAVSRLSMLSLLIIGKNLTKGSFVSQAGRSCWPY